MTTGARRTLVGATAAFAMLVAFGLSAPQSAGAQVTVGAQGSYGSELEAFGLGPRVNIDIPGAQGFGVAGSFDFFFPDNGDWWEINANGTYAFPTEGSVSPYAGAGLNLANASPEGVDDSDTETGLNILGGLQFGGGSAVTPYVEGRYSTVSTGQFVITGGILF